MGISGSTISPVSGSPNHYKIRAERGMDNLEEVPIPIDSIRKYLDEGVIDGKDHSLLLLRYILDNKLGFDSLEYFALRNGYAGLLDCWSDICDWKLKAMGGQENLDENYKNSKKIFQKYLNNTAFCIAFRIDTPSANEAINAGISNDLKRCWNHFKYDLCDICSNNTMNSILEESTCACAELKGWFPFNGFDFLLQIVINMINVYAVCQKYPISVDMLSRYRDRRDSHSISSDHSGTRYNTLERFVKHSSTPALSDANTMVTPSNSIRVTEKDSQCVLSNDNASNILDLICILMERPPTRLCLKDFTYKSVLGAGTFGLVVLCTKISTGKQYAMKIQRLSDVMRARAKTGDNTAECLILQKCKHPFINTLQGSFTTNTFGIMLFDYCPHDTLSKYLRMTADQKLPEGIVVKCTAELCSAVLYLHSNGIIHKDIKPGNILIAPDGHVQLTDFGSAAYSFRGNGCNNMHGKGSFQLDGHIEQDRLFGSNYCGTIGYIAPEVAFMKDNKELPHGYKYTHAVDWWSVGATAYRLLTGKQAADQQTLQTILSDYKFGRGAASGEMDSNLDAVYLKKAPLIEAAGNLSEFGNIPLVSFILALLDVNYETRLGSGLHGNRHIRSHPVFASMSWERLDRKCYNPFYAVSRTHCGTSINPVVPSMMQHVKNDSKFSNSGVFSTVAEFSKCSYNSLFKSNKVYVDCGMSFEKILIAGGKKNWISNLPFSLINYRKNFLRNNLFCDWSYQSVGLLLSEIESLEV